MKVTRVQAVVLGRKNMPDCGKVPYETEGQAQHAAVSRLHSRDNAPTGLRVYRCGRCGKWHLTRQSKG